MVQRNIYDSMVPSYEVRTLPVDMEQVDLLFTLEDVQSPTLLRLAGFRRFVVFEHSRCAIRVLHALGRSSKQP